MTLRDKLKTLQVRRLHPINIEGKEFNVRGLSAAEVVEYHAYTKASPEPSFLDCMTRLVATCLVDDGPSQENRTRQVEELQKDLEQLPYAALAALFRACTEHNRIDEAAVEKAAGNSSAAT